MSYIVDNTLATPRTGRGQSGEAAGVTMFSSEAILECDEAGIAVTLPKTMTSNPSTSDRVG